MLYYETEILRVLYYDLNVDEPYSYCTKWCKNYNGIYFLLYNNQIYKKKKKIKKKYY